MDFHFQMRSISTPNYPFEVAFLADTAAASFENQVAVVWRFIYCQITGQNAAYFI